MHDVTYIPESSVWLLCTEGSLRRQEWWVGGRYRNAGEILGRYRQHGGTEDGNIFNGFKSFEEVNPTGVSVGLNMG